MEAAPPALAPAPAPSAGVPPSTLLSRLSHVALYGPGETTCGYCEAGKADRKKRKASGGGSGSAAPSKPRPWTYGADALALTVGSYLALCNAGFRRAGTYLYQPDPKRRCCPQITIRCDVTRFQLGKGQKRALKRFLAAVEGRGAEDRHAGGSAVTPAAAAAPPPPPRLATSAEAGATQAVLAAAAGLYPAEMSKLAPSGRVGEAGTLPSWGFRALPRGASGAATHSSRLAIVLAGMLKTPPGSVAAAIAGAAAAPPGGSSSGWTVLPAPAPDGMLLAVCDPAAPVLPVPPLPPPPRQAAPAAAAPPPPPAAALPPLPPGPFRVVTVPAAFEEESFQLYCRYQVAVHGDKPSELSRESYTRFLCSSPLVPEPFDPVPAPISRSASKWSPEKEPWAGGKPELAAYRAEAATRAATLRGRVAAACAADALVPPVTLGLAATATAEAQAWLRVAEPVQPGPLASTGHAACPFSGFGAEPSSLLFPSFRPFAAPRPDLPLRDSTHPLVTHGYGAFHHKYYCGDTLIAVGVVDVLPECLSSVYAFYDPALGAAYDLGKVTALYETQWVQTAAACVSPRLKYYYLGFYIHTCPKMRYKAEYGPAELLCPVTRGGWVPLEQALPLLEASGDGFARLLPAPPGEEAAAAAAAAQEAAAARARAAELAVVAVPTSGRSRAPKRVFLPAQLASPAFKQDVVDEVARFYETVGDEARRFIVHLG